jgi:hypothetical protein
MSHLGASTLNGMPILSIDEVIERIDAVGLAELRQIAGELFTPRRLSVAGVGPDEQAFRAAIEPLGAVGAADGERRDDASARLTAREAGG